MSFAYMPWYTGDYLRDTRHLTPQKHGVYLLLLAHCWDQKGPVPLDEQEAAGIANCRSADEIESLRYVLNRYFIRMDDGWYNKRMADVIAHAEQIADGRRKGGIEKARRQRDAVRHAQAVLKQSTSNASPGNPTPNPNPKEKDKDAAIAAEADVWTFGVDLLTRECGLGKGTARSYIGALCRSWPEATVLDALMAAAGKADPKAYARKWLEDKPRKGQRKLSAAEELMEELANAPR